MAAVAKAKEIIATVSAEKAANLPQQMIENIAKGRLGKFLKGMTSLENQIMDDVNDYYTKPSFDSNSYTLDIGESITLTDTKGILSKYNVKSSDGLSVTKSGNKLTITATASAKDNSEIILSNVPSSKQGDSIMYWDGVAGHQKTAVFLVNDPTFAYIDVKVNKYGSLKLAKIDEDGNKVAGTSFKVPFLL